MSTFILNEDAIFKDNETINGNLIVDGNETLTSTSNQLIFQPGGGSGTSFTITATNPTGSRILTIPDPGANGNIIISSANNIFTNNNTFSGSTTFSGPFTTTNTISSTYTNSSSESVIVTIDSDGYVINGNNFSSSVLYNVFAVIASSNSGGNVFQIRQSNYNSSNGAGVWSMRVGGTESHTGSNGLSYGDVEFAAYGLSSSFATNAIGTTTVGGYPGNFQGNATDGALLINGTTDGTSNQLKLMTFYSGNNGSSAKIWDVNLDNTTTTNSQGDVDFYETKSSASRLLLKGNGTGYVGINNSNPQYTLDINGNLNCSSTLTLPSTSNQIILGTTDTITISGAVPSASRIYTIPDAGGNGNFVIDIDNITFSGNDTFSGDDIFSGNNTFSGINTFTNENIYGDGVQNPSSAPVASVVSNTSSVLTGTYNYQITFLNNNNLETGVSATSNSVTYASGSTSGSITFIVGPSNVSKRNIYRNKSTALTPLYLLTTIADNTTTTFADNIADTSLGVAAPSTNSTFPIQTLNGNLTLTDQYNQLIVGSGQTSTLTIPIPSANRIYTIPDAGADGNIVIDYANNTFSGANNFGNGIHDPIDAAGITATGTGILDGTYVWAYTFINTINLETGLSPNGPDGSQTLGGQVIANQSAEVFFDVGPSNTIARNLYRSKTNTTSPLYFLTKINDNTTTTYVDNTADTSLGAQAPSSNSTNLNQNINGSLTLSDFYNQLTFGTGTTIVIDVNTPTSDRVYTLEDVGQDSNIVVDNGSFTFSGTNTFSGKNTFNNSDTFNGENIYGNGVNGPQNQPSVSAVASGPLTGTYNWAYTFVNVNGLESDLSPVSVALTLSSQYGLVDFIVGPSNVSARKIYRNLNGSLTPLALVTTINDNTTTSYQDGVADTNLGAAPPSSNLTNLTQTLNGTLALTDIDNQLIIGSGTTTTVSVNTPSANRVYTLPDAGANGNIVIDSANNTFTGNTTINKMIDLTIYNNATTGMKFEGVNVTQIYEMGSTSDTNWAIYNSTSTNYPIYITPSTVNFFNSTAGSDSVNVTGTLSTSSNTSIGGTLTTSGAASIGGTLTSKYAIFNNALASSHNGTSQGILYVVNPEQGNYYKKIIFYAINYQTTDTYMFTPNTGITTFCCVSVNTSSLTVTFNIAGPNSSTGGAGTSITISAASATIIYTGVIEITGF